MGWKPLKFFSDIIQISQSAQPIAHLSLEEGNDNIVDAFFEYEDLRKEFITAENILLALEHLSQNTPKQGEEPESHMKVVCTLISHAPTKEVFNAEVAKKIIQLNLRRAWESRNRSIQLEISGFLHIAVQCQNAEFVKMFMDEYPESVFEQIDKRYALWHNNCLASAQYRSVEELQSVANRNIRKMLVTKMIEGKPTFRMKDLMEIFQDSEVDELCFDLSRFNSKKYPVSDFVQSLISHKDNPDLLSYERTLKYAEFPNLDAKVDEKEIFGDDVHYEHAEVFLILDWLRDDKNVREIIDLTVPDRLVNPHNEVKIGKYVKLFQVQALNWRFLDLSITVLPDQETKERIKELHLYASGKRAAISHWTSEKGISTLPNDLMTKENCYSTLQFINQEFGPLVKDINKEREQNGREKLKLKCQPDAWNPAQMRLEGLEDISERAVPKLSRFIKSYRDYVHDLRARERYTFRPIKVALIDNGVLSISPPAEDLRDHPNHPNTFDKLSNNGTFRNSHVNHQSEHSKGLTNDTKSNVRKETENHKTLWSRIKGGKSFVEDGSRVSPWLLASNPHGTQMANLICAIDPWCDLYVAKVTEGRAGIMPARVTRRLTPSVSIIKAIRWAIAQKVDIISMSFILTEETDQLRRACNDAAELGIVLLCSTNDEGLAVSTTYPASYSSTITITACDDYGKVLRPGPQGDAGSFQYKVPGQSVAAGLVPFLDSEDRISGSSVATAITASLSSLILSCDRIAKDDPEKYRSKSNRPISFQYVSPTAYKDMIIKKHLNEMLAKESKDYILLENFAGIDKKIRDGRNIEASDIITSYFQQSKFEEE
ncbi:Minor extracellular protease Epr [Trichoderma lentiforme]|uniref:Minor extracellular protease Epr n=1 Tax=Trichoderma lentiforme TaxID=1567552 RepID=A0A9P4XC61_9HYPO|nr:Minor extracellular protease Epr [Trichoderma lentiforme]